MHEHRRKLFKFQTCWLSNGSFPTIVNQAWRQGTDLAQAVESFTIEATRWNKEQFGNVFARKKNIMARLNGTQKALAMHPSVSLINLETDLLRELDIVLNQEEEIWALKSRVNWMIQGDRNTAFYHVSTLVRRKRNKILAIKNAVGDWIQQEEAVKEFVKNGYSDIYTTSLSSVSALPPTISSWQSRLSEEEKCSISVEVSEEEIKAALWSLKAFKAPGPDGLHAGFF